MSVNLVYTPEEIVEAAVQMHAAQVAHSEALRNWQIDKSDAGKLSKKLLRTADKHLSDTQAHIWIMMLTIGRANKEPL